MEKNIKGLNNCKASIIKISGIHSKASIKMNTKCDGIYALVLFLKNLIKLLK